MMDTEFDEHMRYQKYDRTSDTNNYRNGISQKTIKTSQGNVDIDIPRDRAASFDPVIIEKYTRDISDVDNKIINLYASEISTRDISESIRDMYGIEVSASIISKITDTKASKWQRRPLHTVYPNTMQQRCIVHLIRNSCKYLSYKDRKKVLS